MFVVVALIVALHFGTEPLLVALGEPAESIPVAAAYVQAASFGLPFVAVYHSLNKGLQSSGVVLPVLLISVLAKSLCLAGVWAALYLLELNLVAVAWVMSASMALQAVAVYAYMCRTGIAQQWWGRSAAELLSSPSSALASEPSDPSATKSPRIFSWSGLADFCRLAFPACMAICTTNTTHTQLCMHRAQRSGGGDIVGLLFSSGSILFILLLLLLFVCCCAFQVWSSGYSICWARLPACCRTP